MLTVFGNQCNAGGDCLAGRFGNNALATNLNGAFVRRIETEKNAAKLRSASAHQSAEAHHFTGAELERDILKHAAAEAFGTQEHFAGGNGLAMICIAERSSNHVLNEPIAREVFQSAGMHGGPIAQHGDAVADRTQLIKAVGDVNHRHHALAELTHDAKDFASFRFGERRGRLIEDEKARALRDGAADFDELLSGRSECFDTRSRIDAKAVIGDEKGGSLDERAPADPARVGSALVAQKDIFPNAQVGGEQRFLMHHGDAVCGGFRRLGEGYRLAAP